MIKTREQLEALMKERATDDVIASVSEMVKLGDAPVWAYCLRSDAYFAEGKLGRALSDLHTAMSIAPSTEIEQRIRALQSVIEFRNTDILNP
jgi:hypothetical protein